MDCRWPSPWMRTTSAEPFDIEVAGTLVCLLTRALFQTPGSPRLWSILLPHGGARSCQATSER